jgi:hypothetical protein
MNSKYLLLGILVLFFLIIIAYEIYEINEGFADNKPLAVGAPVRQDETCSDEEMAYRIDRFDKARIKKSGEECPTGYSVPMSYPKHVSVANSNEYLLYCLPDCPAGYQPYSNDTTYCVTTNRTCRPSKDLSNTIQSGWSRACAPLYRANLNLLSTMGSISTVVSTINNQYSAIDSEFVPFSNTIMLNQTGSACNAFLRDTIFNQNIISNYYDLTSFNSNTMHYWNLLSNEKNKFNGIFNSFNCANYM